MKTENRDIEDVTFSIREGRIIGNHPCQYVVSPELKSIDPMHFNQVFEPTTTLFFLGLIQNLPKDFVMLDIGANVGYYSTLCSANRPDAEIHAWEPHSKVYEALKMNADKYGFTSYQCGVGAVDSSKENQKITTLYCDNRNMGGHSFIDSEESWGDKKGFQEDIGMYKMECAIVSLQSYKHSIDFSKVAIVKIDTQGMEVEILSDIYDLIPIGAIVIIEDCEGLKEFAEEHHMKLVFDIGIDNVYKIGG